MPHLLGPEPKLGIDTGFSFSSYVHWIEQKPPIPTGSQKEFSKAERTCSAADQVSIWMQ